MVHVTAFARPSRAPNAPSQAVEPMKTRILVVDDDPSVTSLLKRGLSYEGYRVETAASLVLDTGTHTAFVGPVTCCGSPERARRRSNARSCRVSINSPRPSSAVMPGAMVRHAAHHEDVDQGAQQYQRHSTQAAQRYVQHRYQKDGPQGDHAAQQHDHPMFAAHGVSVHANTSRLLLCHRLAAGNVTIAHQS